MEEEVRREDKWIQMVYGMRCEGMKWYDKNFTWKNRLGSSVDKNPEATIKLVPVSENLPQVES